MKIAIPVWEGRISPVLDTAERLLIVDNHGGTETSRTEVIIGGLGLKEKAYKIKCHADVLICGALSRPMELYLQTSDVEVIPWVMGDVECLLNAYVSGNVPGTEFYMPGCGNKRYGRCGRSHRHRKQRGNE